MKTTLRVEPGTVIEPRELITIGLKSIYIPDPRRLVHLQFRRFAGCPVCDLHMHSIIQSHEQIVAALIQEVVVFHSTTEELSRYARNLPLAIVADPHKRLYAEFGVESASRALLDPRAWLPILQGVSRSLVATVCRRQPLPSVNPQGGRFGLPADFLIASDGRVVACKYGSHANDQWSVDELLTLSRYRDSDYPAAGLADSVTSSSKGNS